MDVQLCLLTALAERDKALDHVGERSGDFIEHGLQAIQTISADEVTGEELRAELEGRGIRPHHHNAWGALTMTAIRQGLLAPTERFRNMRGPKSHGRMTRVYRVARRG
jgi:hypothetical protein